MNYVVLDLEWNQPFSRKNILHKPMPLVGEIIQIGAVKLDESKNIMDTFKIDVAPQYYTKMHHKVKKLTRIKDKELPYGLAFPAALELFREWCPAQCLFFTWGHEDFSMLVDNLRLHHMDPDFLPPFYNLQVFWSAQLAEEKRQWSLSSVLEKLSLEPDPSAHDALHDALSAAKICRHLDLELGIRDYESGLCDMRSSCCMQEDLPGRFPHQQAALQSEGVSVCSCPICGEPMVCKTWTRQNEIKQITITSCPLHGRFLVRIKFRRHNGGGVSIHRRLYVLTAQMENYYEEKCGKRGEGESAF